MADDSATRALVPASITPGELVRRADSRIERRTRHLVEKLTRGAVDASEIDDNSPKPDGWSERRYRVASDLRRPQKQQPGYVQLALKMWQSFHDQQIATPQPLNADIKVYVASATFNYPVRDVSDPE